MRFESWGFLFLLAIFPLFHFYFNGRNRPARVTVPFSLAGAPKGSDFARRLLFLKYLGLVLLIIAMARPQSSHSQIERSSSGIDIMLVQDVSMSMEIEDMGERSRFEIAKDMLTNFVKGRGSDRIGFITFAGEAITHAPPTLDYGLLLKSIRDVELGILKDGTAIGDGLSIAINRLRNSTAKSRIIILLTDGDNNIGQIDPRTAGELALGYGIKVYSIAIGTEGEVRMPIRSKDAFGRLMPPRYVTMNSTINPELIKNIAEASGGKFYRVQDEKTLQRVFEDIDRLEKSEVKTTQKIRFTDRFQLPLQLGVLILLLAQLVSQGWWRLAA